MKHREARGTLAEEGAGRSDLARSHPPARSHLGVPPVSSATNPIHRQSPAIPNTRCAFLYNQHSSTSTRAKASTRVYACVPARVSILSSLSLYLSLSSGEKVAVGPVNQSWTREKKRRLGAEPRGNRYGGPGLMAVRLAC